MARILVSLALAMLLVVPAVSAPGPKESDKPLPAVTPAQRNTSVNNLRQIGIAMHNYHDTHGHLPANLLTKDGKPGLSWRVAILPFIEEMNLYQQFKLDEPWDSENNKKLIDKLPKLYTPSRGRSEKGETFYQMFVGKSTMLGADGKGITFAGVTDGLSNTFMIVEGGKPVTWTKPDDLPFDGTSPPALGGMFDGEFHALLGDGSVKRIPKGMDAKVLRYLIDRQDGQVVDLDGEIKKAQGK